MNAWMKRLSNNLHLLTLAAALIATGGLVVACGGGGSGGGAGSAPTSTRSMGEITAKGSVTVNGVKFETTGAQIVMDGGVPATGDDSDLRVGMMVEVAGEINADGVTGTATTVNFEDTIQGPVTAGSRTVVDDSFDIMGKKVFVVQDTTIDDSTGLPRGFNDISGEVEVSAGIDDQGRIVATHIELKPAGAESEVTGVVDSIGPLVVAGINVTTDASTTFSNFPAGAAPAAGDFVEVKGSFVAPTLTATSIELKTGIADDDNFHFEGFVISGDANAFVLQGRHLDQQLNVTTTSATSFEGGPRGDLIVGTKVEVEGNLTAGTIAATKVKFRENVRIRMAAGAPSADLSTLTLTNLSAVTVQTNALTREEDNSTAAGIGLGDQLEIRGRMAADGSIIATRLRVDQPSSNPERVILRGPVTSVSGSTIVLLGVSVNTATVGVEFRPNDDNSNDDNAQTMSQVDFMAQVKAGTVIKVRGVLTGDNLLAADELELED